VAIIDGYSRYVLSSEVSITLEKEFCLRSLERVLQRSKPEIFNTDQGVQFTNNEFTGQLEPNGIAISLDGRGEPGIISLLNASGAASNMKKYTSMTTTG